MRGWTPHVYEVKASEDAQWEAAFEALPGYLGCQIEQDFGVSWIAELSEVEACRMVLAMGANRITSLGEGILVVPDCYRAEFGLRFSQSTGARCRWTRLRRAHFATVAAQAAFEALL